MCSSWLKTVPSVKEPTNRRRGQLPTSVIIWWEFTRRRKCSHNVLCSVYSRGRVKANFHRLPACCCCVSEAHVSGRLSVFAALSFCPVQLVRSDDHTPWVWFCWRFFIYFFIFLFFSTVALCLLRMRDFTKENIQSNLFRICNQILSLAVFMNWHHINFECGSCWN